MDLIELFFSPSLSTVVPDPGAVLALSLALALLHRPVIFTCPDVVAAGSVSLNTGWVRSDCVIRYRGMNGWSDTACKSGKPELLGSCRGVFKCLVLCTWRRASVIHRGFTQGTVPMQLAPRQLFISCISTIPAMSSVVACDSESAKCISAELQLALAGRASPPCHNAETTACLSW